MDKTRRDIVSVSLSLYVDDVMKALSNSGYGIFVGGIFILYADDTVL